MAKSNDLTARRRILDAAARVFAESSFDGARVDEIARQAGVNKALIYYYFKSKEELLTILFQETRDAVLSLLDSDRIKNLDYGSSEAIKSLMLAFLELLEERQDVIRVVIMECAKRTPINTLIFAMIGEIMDKMFDIAGETDYTAKEARSRVMVTEFFTGVMPLLDYVAYHEIWMDRYGMDESTLRSLFIEAFLGTHFAYTIKKTDS